MVYFLRNISIRLWISILFSAPITFTLFPSIKQLLPNTSASIFCMFLALFMFIVTGYVMNIVGERFIYRLINEAKQWERDGSLHKSELSYLKALELFDSYLLTVLNAKKIALSLTGAIARFSLTAGCHNDYFDNTTIYFLLRNPNETEVAYLWLQKILKQKISPKKTTINRLLQGKLLNSSISNKDAFIRTNKNSMLTEQEESLISLLAEMEPLNLKLVPLMAEIFTITQRTDFAAKRIFAITKNSEQICVAEEVEQAQHFEPEKKNIIYQEAHPFSEKIKVGKDTRKVSKKSYSIKHFSKYRMLSTIQTIISPILCISLKAIILIASLPMNIIDAFINLLKYLLHTLISALNNIRTAIALHPDLNRNIKRFIIVVSLTGVTLFFINTLSHLIRTPSQPTLPSTPKIVTEDIEVQVVPQKKFTIQVAAYLVKSHAEQYLAALVKKGVSEGSITSVEGGGKTWYLIRVGMYETKESATTYGNKLKSQNIINDFFVDNSGG